MPAFFGDSMDLYALPADALLGYWDSGTTGFTLGAGRFSGSRAIVHSATGAWLVKSSGSNDATHHIVCAYQQTAAISGTTLGLYLQLTDGTTNQVCIVFRSDGAILLTSATPGGTVLATYTGAVTAISTWYAFEIEVVINNTTGSFAVRKNGNTSNDFSATSLNTRPGTNAYANKLTVGSNAAVTGASFDDLLWRSDAASVPWVGDIRCYTRRPASDAAVQWSQGGGASGLSQSQGGNAANLNMVVNVARLTPFTVNYTGSITTVTIVTGSSGGPGNMKAAIWADSAGVPGTVLASAGPISFGAAGNNVFTLSTPLAVTAGQRIWVGAIGDVAIGFGWAVNSTITTGGTVSVAYASFPQANPVMGTGQQVVVCSITFGTASGNAALVSEQQQDAAASYVYSSTVGQADLYTISGIDSTPTTIIGVTTRALAQKSDAGARIITADLKSGGTTVHSGSGVLNTVFGWVYRTDLVDPATGSAWTPTGVNNAQIGITLTA